MERIARWLFVAGYVAANTFALTVVAVWTANRLDVTGDSMPTLYLEPERRTWFADKDGRWTVYKDNDSVLSYTIDWSRLLGSDTISSVSWEVSGVVSQSQSNTSTATTITLSKTGGTAKATIVTAGGLTHIRRFQFLRTES